MGGEGGRGGGGRRGAGGECECKIIQTNKAQVMTGAEAAMRPVPSFCAAVVVVVVVVGWLVGCLTS